MKTFNLFDEIPFDKNTVLTVGTFDGVHRGHREIIQQLLEKKQNLRRYNNAIFYFFRDIIS